MKVCIKICFSQVAYIWDKKRLKDSNVSILFSTAKYISTKICSFALLFAHLYLECYYSQLQ